MVDGPGRLRGLFAGVRLRTTVVAVVVVGIVLVAAVIALRFETKSRLEDSIVDSVEARAADLATLVEADAVSNPIGGSREVFAQIVAPDGTVVAASPGLLEIEPFAPMTMAPGESEQVIVDGIFEQFEEEPGGLEDEGPYTIVVLGARGPDGMIYTVQAGATLEPASEAVNELSPLLFLGLPLVLIVVGSVVWLLTGRALRPVDAMRNEAEAISAAEFDRRLPVPPSEDEVHRLAETLNAMLDRLEASAVRQRQFVGDASHELKSPVAAIRAMLEVAADSPDFSEWQTLVADLRREDARLERLVEDLLTLARTDEGAPPSRRVEVDLDQIAGREGGAIAATGTAVHTAGLQPVRVLGDPERLAMLFRNLVENAARYGSELWIESGTGSGRGRVWVSDDGPGIPDGERERVFERFVRLDEARSRSAGGTGLGLAVCSAIARAHGGSVRVVDARHGGATIEVELPLAG